MSLARAAILGTRRLDAAAAFQLTKPGIAAVVVMTATAGFLLGSPARVDWARLALALIGTALAASGAGALNMLLERSTDALMERTRRRPLPSGRASPREALSLGAFCAVAGVALLSLLSNAAAGAAAAATLALYLFLYTPLKRVSAWCMLPGAISGALPPLIGYAAATGGLGRPGWSLFAILFLWQLPHIVALGWMYREDYARAGLRMLPEGETGDLRTVFTAAVSALLLIPAGLVPVELGLAGSVYACGSVLLGSAYAAAALHFGVKRCRASAKRLFLVSIAYVPFLLLLLAAGR